MTKLEANNHYEEDPRFYQYTEIGYSCNYWEKGASTNSEAALHKYEVLENLIQPQGRMLEVGFGKGDFSNWMKTAHPEVELDAIDLAAAQVELAKTKNPDVNFMLKNLYNHQGKYDRIYSDEMMVHIPSNYKFFKKCREMLNPGGIMVHKELHKTSFLSVPYFRCRALNKPFDMSGKYVTAKYDLQQLRKLGFRTTVHNWDIMNYVNTLRGWIVAMESDKEEMIEINEAKYYRDRANWHRFLSIWSEDLMNLNIMVSTQIDV